MIHIRRKKGDIVKAIIFIAIAVLMARYWWFPDEKPSKQPAPESAKIEPVAASRPTDLAVIGFNELLANYKIYPDSSEVKYANKFIAVRGVLEDTKIENGDLYISFRFARDTNSHSSVLCCFDGKDPALLDKLDKIKAMGLSEKLPEYFPQGKTVVIAGECQGSYTKTWDEIENFYVVLEHCWLYERTQSAPAGPSKGPRKEEHKELSKQPTTATAPAVQFYTKQPKPHGKVTSRTTP
jgi:hypothetical protein